MEQQKGQIVKKNLNAAIRSSLANPRNPDLNKPKGILLGVINDLTNGSCEKDSLVGRPNYLLNPSVLRGNKVANSKEYNDFYGFNLERNTFFNTLYNLAIKFGISFDWVNDPWVKDRYVCCKDFLMIPRSVSSEHIVSAMGLLPFFTTQANSQGKTSIIENDTINYLKKVAKQEIREANFWFEGVF
jgi:hypothetical protein